MRKNLLQYPADAWAVALIAMTFAGQLSLYLFVDDVQFLAAGAVGLLPFCTSVTDCWFMVNTRPSSWLEVSQRERDLRATSLATSRASGGPETTKVLSPVRRPVSPCAPCSMAKASCGLRPGRH